MNLQRTSNKSDARSFSIAKKGKTWRRTRSDCWNARLHDRPTTKQREALRKVLACYLPKRQEPCPASAATPTWLYRIAAHVAAVGFAAGRRRRPR
jgi:hypothetical protein